MLCVFHMWSPA